MEKSTAPRARFIAAILLFAAVVIGDLILSRGYLAQGPATWPVFLLLELVMLALLVIGGILFCNRRGLDSNKKLILGFGFFLVWCVLTVIFFADYKALYLSTLHTEYPSYGAAITCLKLVLVLCGLTALIPVAPAPTGRAYADGLARAYQKQNIEQAKTAAAEAQKDLERRVEQLRSSMSPEELEALTRKLKQESAPAAAEESHEKTEEKWYVPDPHAAFSRDDPVHRSAAGDAGCGLFHRQGHDQAGEAPAGAGGVPCPLWRDGAAEPRRRPGR